MITVWQRLMTVGFVLSMAIGCDQTTKRIAEKTLNESAIHSMFFDTFRLQFVHNSGVLLGLGSNFSEGAKWWLFLVLPLVLLSAAAFFVVFSSKLNRAQVCFLTMIIGGGTGNLIDRILQGSVTDFINVGIGSLRTGIFNVADVAILVGALGLIAAEYWHKKSPQGALDVAQG